MGKRDMRLLAVLTGVAIMVSACGGGDGGGTDTVGGGTNGGAAVSIPAAALASVESLVGYAKELLGRASEAAEPIGLGDSKLPSSETAEPLAAN